MYDPWIDAIEAKREYGITPITQPVANQYDAIILAVAHEQFVEMGVEVMRAFGRNNHVLYDLKYLFSKEDTDMRL